MGPPNRRGMNTRDYEPGNVSDVGEKDGPDLVGHAAKKFEIDGFDSRDTN